MIGPDVKTVSCPSCPFRSRCVLSAVEPEVIGSSASRVQRVRFEKGGTIIHEGTPSTGWAILCQGRARRTVSAGEGKRLLLCFYGPGELLSTSLSGPQGSEVRPSSGTTGTANDRSAGVSSLRTGGEMSTQNASRGSSLHSWRFLPCVTRGGRFAQPWVSPE